MKRHIEDLITQALRQIGKDNDISCDGIAIQIEQAKDKQHGDYSSNIALVLAKALKKKPRDLAANILAALSPSGQIEKVEIAGPGFINFFVSTKAATAIIENILQAKEAFGKSAIGAGKKIIVEFVSSNPTGPLHVGHGRHAAFGMVVSNLLNAAGFNVYREYYVNDGGRQMDILATSVWLRYLSLQPLQLPFPANAYKGEYVIDIAKILQQEVGDAFVAPIAEIFSDLPADLDDGGDKDVYIDAVIQRAKLFLADKYSKVYEISLTNILADMKNDLQEFGVEFDNWFSERDFINSGAVEKTLEQFKTSGHTYQQDDALWFRSTDFGDSKDRVLVRANGNYTYFAPDAAYHLHKFARGFDQAIDIFGSDHHGYLQRMKAVIECMSIDPARLLVLLVQFVTLYKGGELAQMSTRAGDFVTLRELRHEVGNDAARYFYVMRKNEQPMDFDLDLAKAHTNENPVYYVQYAHARICSVLRQVHERGMAYDEAIGLQNLELLDSSAERELLNTLSRYADVIASAAVNHEPYQVTNYLRDLAANFHSYYNSQQFLVDDVKLRNARLTLITAVKQILVNSFSLLGISAPETM